MRAARLASVAATATAVALSCAPLAFAQSNPHVGHVMTGFRGTPDGQGLLPTAVAEARIAVQHAGLAARTPDDLDAMKRHTGHVVHAVDPSVEANGPGLGYGVKRAAAGVAQHIGLAAGTEGASDNIKMHAVHVAASANGVVARADQILALAARIRAAGTAGDAAPLVAELVTLTGQLISGVDANGDGRIGWQAEEGGLEQAETHMGLLQRGEGGR